jgi:predicted membrane channel-forming protein YqfA (hemolysin III family)
MSCQLATSLLFLTNITHAYYVQAAWLHHAWVLVLTTSLLYHAAPDEARRQKAVLRRVDQGAVLVLVCVGAVYWCFIPFAFKVAALVLFGTCIVLYAYGFKNKCLCFAKPPYDRMWHSVMHVAAVIGHHLIMFGMWP